MVSCEHASDVRLDEMRLEKWAGEEGVLLFW